MPLMSVTFDVLKFETSKEVRPLQSLNIANMLVTFAVLKLETSKEVKPLQPQNIARMSVTFAVLKFETSKEVRPLQSQNIASMSVTFSVFRYSIPTISFNKEGYSKLPANQYAVLVGLASANEASNTALVISLPWSICQPGE